MSTNVNEKWPFHMATYPIQPNISRSTENWNSTNDSPSVTIASFNILAESYLSARSHKNLPHEYASVVFDSKKRRTLLLETLHKLIHCKWSPTASSTNHDLHYSIQNPSHYNDHDHSDDHNNDHDHSDDHNNDHSGFDIICLQEVDMYEDLIEPFMKEHGYVGFQSKSEAHEKNGKIDSCAIFWKSNLFDCIQKRIVDFDDLANETKMETETSSESISYSTSNKMEANSNLTNTNNMNDLYNFDETLNVNIHGDPYPTNPPTYYAKKKKKTQYRKQNSPSALMGVKRSFIRRNSSCLILLQYKDVARQQKHQQNQKSPPSIIAVANAHLYWNPGFEYVKLAQSKYLLEEMHDFVTSSFISGDEIPVIICGDMNSKPSSMVHQFFTNQMGVDARMIAPWNTYSTECDDDQYDQINAKQSILTKNIAYEIEGLNIHDMRVSNDIIAHNNDKKDNDIPQVRYLLDFSLNKFTRWLRMLGIDAELETEEEEEKRTRSSDPYITLFERCKNEKRTLITTSYKLLQRKGCPPGAYLINPAAQNMEETLCHLLITHGVILEPSKFLVRCVRCNSGFREITDINEKRVIFAKNKAPMLTDLSVWECKGCMRGYWWNEAPDSSASRVKNQVTKLFRLALRSGVEYKGSLGLFDFINVEEEQRYGRELGGTGKGMVGCEDRGNNGSGIGGKVKALEWLKDKQLSHPYKLRSMYARINIDANSSKEIVDGEILPFTNVTSDFVGALDYIFFESSKWTLTHRLVVPTTFQGMNVSQITKGHLIPSSYWPSDHLAIGGRLVLKTTKTLFQPVLNKTEQGVMHKEISKMKENKQSQNLSFLPVSLLSQMEQDMISKEPLKREKTTFSPFTNNETNTATEKVSLEQKKEDINLHQEKKKEHKLTGKCYCGCVPNILSLIEMAELRRKHREKQKLKNSIK